LDHLHGFEVFLAFKLRRQVFFGLASSLVDHSIADRATTYTMVGKTDLRVI